VRHNKDGEQRLFNLFGLFSFLFILTTTTLFAGSFENFKQVQSESFEHYKDARDNAFHAYLKAQWKEYKAYITPPLYTKPKPKSITPLREEKAPDVGPIVQVRLPQQNKQKLKNIPKSSVKKDVVIEFFGSTLGFDVDRKLFAARFYPQNQAGIANFFSLLASSDYDRLLREIRSCQKRMQLNDWAVYLLVKRISQKVYKESDDAKILSWFMLNKLGFDVKIALNDAKDVVLLSYSKDIIYATPRYKFGSKEFYAISRYNSKADTKIYTYVQEYPHATKALDFTLRTLPKFVDLGDKRDLSFVDFGQRYNVSYSYNKNLIDFMATYPQVAYKVYFNAPLEFQTYDDIAKNIKVYIDGKKMSEAMDFVLHFVQKAFKYERDKEQFGHEKVMFAEETLAYRASDCEDRATLFSYLIKKLFGVSVVGVKYSDHMSTALYIPLKGDSVHVGRRRYVVADPTYVNANLGQSMPRYKSIMPESFIYVR